MKLQDLTTPLFEDTCAPLAIARALGLPYNDVMQTCEKFQLWRSNFGMRDGQILHAIRKLGWDYQEQTRLAFVRKVNRETGTPYFKLCTLNQLLPKLDPNGKYIITLKDHAIAYIDGRIHDDSQYGHKHQIKGVYRIIPKEPVAERRQARLKRRVIMYHGTSTAFLSSILKQGLLVNPPKRTYAGDESEAQPHLETMGGIYLSTSYNSAAHAADAATNKFGGWPMIVIVQYNWGHGDIDEDKIINVIQGVISGRIETIGTEETDNPDHPYHGYETYDGYVTDNYQKELRNLTSDVEQNLKFARIYPNKVGKEILPQVLKYILDHVDEDVLYSGGFMLALRYDKTFIKMFETLMGNVSLELGWASSSRERRPHNIRVHQNITYRGPTRIIKIEQNWPKKTLYVDPRYKN